MRRFNGRVAVVTGGASGIGKALGAGLVKAGAQVLLADVNEEGVRAAAADLRCEGMAVDVRDPAAVEALVARAVDRWGRIDLMFNNAGVGVGGQVADLKPEDWTWILDVNLRGVIHGVQAAYPRMIAQKSGHIVNTASLAGLVPVPGLVPYATTKHAVVGLSTSLRAEAKRHGVSVTAVCPGFVNTPILDSPFRGSEKGKKALEKMVRRVPLMKVDDLAAEVLKGVARDEAMIVAPRSARMAWRSYRLSPRHVLSLLERGSKKKRRR